MSTITLNSDIVARQPTARGWVELALTTEVAERLERALRCAHEPPVILEEDAHILRGALSGALCDPAAPAEVALVPRSTLHDLVTSAERARASESNDAAHTALCEQLSTLTEILADERPAPLSTNRPAKGHETVTLIYDALVRVEVDLRGHRVERVLCPAARELRAEIIPGTEGERQALAIADRQPWPEPELRR